MKDHLYSSVNTNMSLETGRPAAAGYVDPRLRDTRSLPLQNLDPDALFDGPLFPENPDKSPSAENDYQRRIQGFELLTPEQEQALAVSIKSGREAEERLRRRVRLASRPGLKAVVEEGESAKMELFTKNLRLAAWVARMSMNLPNQTEDASDDPAQRVYRGTIFGNLAVFAGWPMPLADRIQAANIGLLTAVDKFKPQDCKFSTMAMYDIESTLVREIYNYGEASGARMPAHVCDEMRKIRAAESLLASQAQDVTHQSVAEIVNFDVKKTAQLRHGWDVHSAVTWDVAEAALAAKGHEEDYELTTMADLYEDEDESVEHQAVLTLLADDMDNVLDTLADRERGIIALRFGLYEDNIRTLDEVGAVYGVTRERVRQVEGKAMEKLRHPSRSQHLRPYMDDYSREKDEPKPAARPVFSFPRPMREAAGEDPEIARSRAARRRAMELLTTFGKSRYDTEELDTKLGKEIGSEYLEWFWNHRLTSVVETYGRESFDFGRFNAAFSQLLDRRIGDDTRVSLTIPEVYSPVMDNVASGMTHGTVEIQGSVGKYCAENLSGSAQVIVNGNAGHMAGANMSQYAVLDVSGSVGSNAGMNMRDEAQLFIGGDAGPNLGRGAVSGVLEIEGRADSVALADNFAGVFVSQYMTA